MGIISTVLILWNMFRKYRKHAIALVVLGSLAAVLEGIGINAVIPLMSFFSGAASTPTDFITKAISDLFSFFSIPFTFRYLLGFILALFLLRAIASVVFGYVRGWITADYLSDETEDLLRETMRASWPFLLKQKIGNLHTSIVRDIGRTGSLLEVTSQVIQSFTGFFMYLLVAFSISPQMTSSRWWVVPRFYSL
jgi:ABC-type multidrug transport system fused ATPase/permease subunit